MNKQKKHIVLGVTGGIAIYKVLDLIRSLQKKDLTVEVIMTKSAQEFITPLTFRELTGNPVHTEMFNPPKDWTVEHISLARKADLMAIIPATANIIGKIASGIADDLLTTTVMAMKKPVLLAPAMNTAMYENPIVQKNLSFLNEMGYKIVPPDAGILLCGEEGKGKLASIEVLEEEILRLITKQDFLEKKILITAGPTREYLDPVRFLSNPSSGRMGYALACEAARRGGEVVLISGPTHLPLPYGVRYIPITTTEQLFNAVLAEMPEIDIFIMAAAPADFRPEMTFPQKMKKTAKVQRELSLVFNPDVAKTVGERKGKSFLTIFAAESENLRANARDKLIRKNADLVVANDIIQKGAGFEEMTNKVILLTEKEEKSLPLLSKQEVATEILSSIFRLSRGLSLVEPID